MSPLLELTGLHAAYGPSAVLHGIDLQVAEGGIATLLGANGAGKTTTLRAICQMMVAVTGEIRFAGERIDRLETEAIVRRGVAHVPDGRGTFTDLTVEENLRLGAYTRRDRKAVTADFDRIYDHFPRLRERRGQQAGTLSGGEQQMLAISRALMLRPRLLLLDEPSFGLAPLVVRDIFAILRRINQADRVGILLVEQNASLALDLADHAYLLETGRIALAGPSAEIAGDEAVRRAYLGY
ncbi:MAG: branched-chain amino acid transport system ATP-binding protein [Aliidongia sp.]|jgi:branched-chain amino acid transport system ATP-binding protein|nr:branched-chain amino acid transport system ATP-binding protein [Aliidongia sp.]